LKSCDGLPFSLTWWSFTFPLGTYVTGSAALAAQTRTAVFADAAICSFVVLLIAWFVVGCRTINGIARGAFNAAPLGS